MRSAPPPQSDDSATAWFGRMSLLHRPMFWIPILVLLGLGTYHLVWYSGDTGYSTTALTTVLGCAGVALAVLFLVKTETATLGVCVRVLLTGVGFAMAALGIDLILGVASVGTAETTDVVGALALMGGIFVFAVGVYIRTDLDRPSAVSPGQAPLAREEFQLGEAMAVLRRYRNFGSGTNRLVDYCRPQLTTADLHFVAYYVDGECRFTIDVLEDPEVDRFFDQVTPDNRRDHYLQQANYLDRQMTGLNAHFREIDAGILIRVVLDVERGALYYYWIDDRRFIIGVTLDQEMVDKADRKMVHIVDSIRVSLGHRRIGDLER